MKHDLEQAILIACQELFGQTVAVELTRPDDKFGDYATNIALQLAKTLGKNPREVAESLAAKLREVLSASVSKIEIAGPGFINMTLTDEALLSIDTVALPNNYSGQKIVIETNNPNPFKDMHIGHAYNSIIADTISNLLEAGQAEVHRVSYHGDVGLHVGKSMWAILKFVDGDIGKLDTVPESSRAKFLSEKYAEGAKAYDEDENAKAAIESLADHSFEQSDELYQQIYETCKNWSFGYFDDVFKSIGSSDIERRYLESETDRAGRQAVESNIGPVFEKSDGAIIFPGEKYGLHTRVFISSRDKTLYEARDLGLIQLKQADFAPEKSYIVTAVEQKQYFQVVFKAAELIMPELHGVTQNISTGTVLLSTGKMSSRTGNVVNIGWLFEALDASLRARGANDDGIQSNIVAALRYTMLKNRLGSDVVFDVTEAISIEGNTGPYLQYAHARAKSILSKARARSAAPKEQLQAQERTLARKISEYPEVLEVAVTELMPHHICTYLYELAQTFNRFYEHNRVIDDEREALRLKLVDRYATTLSSGLGLLGIHAPDKM